MRSQHLPMTWEAFELMARKPGWKHEYWNGQAHISPRHQVVTVAVTVQPRPVSAPCRLRPVAQDDESQLVAAALNALHSTGVPALESSYMLGNAESQAWHQKFGFVEEPDLFLAQAYYRHSQHELWRRQTIGDLTDAQRHLLSAAVEHWQRQVETLQAIADQQGMEAVSPLLRRRYG